MSGTSALGEVLSCLSRGLDRAGVRWYVFGAQAVVVYGEPRLTSDLDVTVECPPERARALLALLADSGLSARSDDPHGMAERARVMALIHEPTGTPVDIVLAGPGLEEEFLANRRTVEVSGVSVPVISAEDLIVGKILAGRGKDLEDVEGILREQSDSLDLERSRHFLLLLEQALGRGDLLPQLERLLERIAG